MTVATRLTHWNLWYDGLPEFWRFQFIVWSLLVLGTINMMLTIAVRFPFALLVVLAILIIAALRVPYAMGWVAPPDKTVSPGWRFQHDRAQWLVNVNRRYEALPESRRIWVYPAVLLIAGAINMMLTIAYRFPFGLLFLLALLALVAIRAPYAAKFGTGGDNAVPAGSGGQTPDHP